MEETTPVADGQSSTTGEAKIRFSRTMIGIALIAVVLLGLNSLREPRSDTPPTPEVAGVSVTPTEEISPIEYPQIGIAEIVNHNTKEDCWFAIEGKVYNVTEYISQAKHPGRDAIVQGCGKDATELFNTRPMGSKTPHSDKARGYLLNFQIGILKNEE